MTPFEGKYIKVHCIGIGGSGLGSLALFLKNSGVQVSGSDINDSPLTMNMAKKGMCIFSGHSYENLPPDTGLVIYSSAVPSDNPELLAAKKKGIACLSYPQAIGLITKEHQTISVCGTHGKTTTTAMAAAAFVRTAADPCVIVGSAVPELGGKSYRYGKGKHLILESCEHFRSFLNYSPSHAIVTNIDLDHLDYYKNLDDYIGAFREFFSRIPSGGLLIANGDDQNIKTALKGLDLKNAVFYGKDSACTYRLNGTDIMYKGKRIASLELKVPGMHNVCNAAAVFALCHELGMDMHACLNALKEYRGSGRRFEIKGKIGRTTVIDDYAHHPVEIAATLKALRDRYGRQKKILCLFQPHQYSRTRHLLEGFTGAFGDADAVMVSDILKIRDSKEDIGLIDAEIFARKISLKHGNVRYGGNLRQITDSIKTEAASYDFIITMGAGDIWKVADGLVAGNCGNNT